MAVDIIEKTKTKLDCKSKLDWALEIAGRGYSVFPLHHTLPDGSCTCGKASCTSQGKHPLFSYGHNAATNEREKIEAWWDKDPDANIGVNPGDNHVFIDLDVKKGNDGYARLAELLKIPKEEVIKLTYAVVTPTGGAHLYFNTDTAYGNRGGILPGIDVRGQTGYVLAPGSTIYTPDEFGDLHEEPYRTVTDIAEASLPFELQSFLRKSKERAENAHISLDPENLDSPAAIADARELLKHRPIAIEGQGGDDHTLVTAMQVKDRNISKEVCFDLMTEVGGWNDRCLPPWDDAALRSKIDNAYEYGKEQIGSKRSLMEQLFRLGGLEDSELPPGFFNQGNDKHDSDSAAPGNDNQDSDFADNAQRAEPRFKIYAEDEGMEGPPLDMVIDGLLAMGYQTLFYGDEQTLKTFIVLEMILCAITGKKFLSYPGEAESGFAVLKKGLSALYICGEGFNGIKKQKVPLWKKHHGISADTVLPFYMMDVMPSVLDEDAIKDLAADIKAKFNERGDPLPDLIAVDTLVYALAPDGKEDSNDDATKLYRAGKRLSELLGKPLIIFWIHHKGHVAVRARGASNITTSSDVRYRVEHVVEPKLDYDREHPTCRSYHVRLNCEKFKDTTLPLPVEFKGKTVFDVEANGLPISTVILEGVKPLKETFAEQIQADLAADELRELVGDVMEMNKATEASVNQVATWCAAQVKSVMDSGPRKPSSKRHYEKEIPKVLAQPYLRSDGLHWVRLDKSTSGNGRSVFLKGNPGPE